MSITALFMLENVLPVLEDIVDSDECEAADGTSDGLCSLYQCRASGCIVLKIRQIRALLAEKP